MNNERNEKCEIKKKRIDNNVCDVYVYVYDVIIKPLKF